jgi:nucleotide-binding universal stress UspA family protein
MLHEYKNRAESIQVTVARTIQSVGNAAEEILKITSEKNIDTLVIGKKGKYGTTKDMLGGTSYKLLHFSKCTVTVVK